MPVWVRRRAASSAGSHEVSECSSDEEENRGRHARGMRRWAVVTAMFTIVAAVATVTVGRLLAGEVSGRSLPRLRRLDAGVVEVALGERVHVPRRDQSHHHERGAQEEWAPDELGEEVLHGSPFKVRN